MKTKLVIIHAPCDEIELQKECNVFCVPHQVYLLPQGCPDYITLARSIYDAEKEKMEWIRKYDSLLKGLNYWKNKAKEL